jgi:alpha-tubulin suppressor-like RCC1 family protein
MSSNLVANVTITGNLFVQGTYANVNFLNTVAFSQTFLLKGSTSTVTAVATGAIHTAALLTDGSVQTFGDNSSGQLGVNDTISRLTPVQMTGITNASTIACGYSHTVMVLGDGTVRTCGRNDAGQLGVNDTTSRLTPVQVLNITSATAVACGWFHTAVLLANGTVWAFGNGGSGRLGINDTTSRLTPVQVWGISSSAVAVACGAYHTMVLLANGTVQTFGYNNVGQLGVNDSTSRLTPVQVWGISSSASAVAGGKYHTAVLLTNGTLQTFGFNTSGQLGVNDTTQRNTPVQVWGISSSAIAVSCGYYFTSVLLTNGTVQTFGSNFFGQMGVFDTTNRLTPVQVLNITSARSVQCGGYHAAVLLSDGTFRTYGRGNAGQLGVADTQNRLFPVKVGVSGNKVAGGRVHTAVLSSSGTVNAFGRNAEGELGVGDTVSRLTPVQVLNITSAIAVACGYYHTAVLLADGTVRTFGQNGSGQLGVNDTVTRLTPVQVLNISTATAIACGWFHTLVLLVDGTVRTFGNNTQGQLGVNGGGNRSTPVQVWGISSSATAIAGGQYHTAVLLANGTIQTFGLNTSGQLGVNDTTQRNTPVQVWGISSSAAAVACGRTFTAVLLANGTIQTFGTNNQGQLGVNDTTQRNTPVQVWGISSSATSLACGYYHGIVTLTDGTLRTWGFNSKGQLGVNDTTQRNTPVQVWGISSSATAIAGGVYHTALLINNGTVQTCGLNDNGQLGLGDTSSRLTPVQIFSIFPSMLSAGYFFTAVVLSNGTVQAWGNNTNGQLGVNDTVTRLTPVQVLNISSAISVSCGYWHTLILLKNGTVWACGNNGNGQLGVNDTTLRSTPVQVLNITSATAIAAGYLFSMALLANGTIQMWGGNNVGQLGVNDTVTRLTPVQVLNITSAIAIAAPCFSAQNAMALLADGTIRAWGGNGSGQLGVNDTTSRLTPVQVWGISSSAVSIGFAGAGAGGAVLADGTVRSWGYNGNYQLGAGNIGTSRLTPVQVLNISTATAIACGTSNMVVLLKNGTVWAWGNAGGLGSNETVASSRATPVQVWGISSSAVAVACGQVFSGYILMNGTVLMTGRNAEGELGVNDTTIRYTPVQVLNISTASGVFFSTATAVTTPLSTVSPFAYPYVQVPALNLGPVASATYQLDMSSDAARKLTTSTWTIGSDERLKTDIETANVARCVEIVQNLDLKYFKWELPNDSETAPDKHSLGWIAQEFAQFFPKSVEEAPAHGIEDFKNLNSDQIIKVMWGALKKLRADLKAQRSSGSA